MSEALHALKSSSVCSPFLTHATRLSLRLCHVAKGGRAELLLRSKWTLMVKDISWDFFLGLICDKISSVGNKLLTLNRSPWDYRAHFPFLSLQAGTQQAPNPSSICSASAPAPTSSPTACPPPWWAVPPRPWTCSWRAMPSPNPWLPRPNGEGPHFCSPPPRVPVCVSEGRFRITASPQWPGFYSSPHFTYQVQEQDDSSRLHHLRKGPPHLPRHAGGCPAGCGDG